MASKKSAKKKAAPKKKAAKKSAAGSGKVQVTLTPRHQAQVEACIKKSGKATFGIKEVSVSRLPKAISSIVVID